MIQCPHCGREAPDEAFCTWCGAHLSGSVADPRRRRHHYAADPTEHVAHPSVVTTLFPHLPRHRVHEFRWGLAGGLAVVVLLVAGGLIVAAILAAAVLVPSLYLVYLYEAQVYRDEPAKVVGLTMAAGAVIGVLVSVVADSLLHEASPLHLSPTAGYLAASAILLPVVQEVLKPLPAFVLRIGGGFAETIDGLTFGVSAGLGFAAAETIVQFSRVLGTEPVHSASASWLFPVIGITVLTPLMQASCTGAVTASLWNRRGRSRSVYAAGVPVAFGVHVAYSAVGQLLADHGVDPAIVAGYQLVVVGVALVYLRELVHVALLDEAVDVGFSAVVCPHCRQSVGAAAFCPRCGGAVTAGPRRPEAAALLAGEGGAAETIGGGAPAGGADA